MKTLKVEAVYITEYESFEDVAADLPASSTRSTTPAGYTPPLSQPDQFEDRNACPDPVKTAA